MEELSRQLISEIQSTLRRTNELLRSNILWSNPTQIYYKSVFIEVLINLNDLLSKADQLFKKRIDFIDDVRPDKEKSIADITDLIRHFRNAACHIGSGNRKYEPVILSYNIVFGRGNLIGNIPTENPYPDDIAYNFGGHMLLLDRHIQRAYRDVSDVLKPALGQQ